MTASESKRDAAGGFLRVPGFAAPFAGCFFEEPLEVSRAIGECYPCGDWKITRYIERMAKRSTTTAVFYGNMDWFDVEDEPGTLPPAFAQAKKLWKADPKRNGNAVIKLLQPYAAAAFLPSTLLDWEEWFADPNGDGMPEIKAAWVRLLGVDFKKSGRSPLPVAKMEAEFEVSMKASFKPADFHAWLDDNGVSLYDAVSFMWSVPDADASDGVALYTWTNNEGQECILTKKKRASAD